MSYSCFCGKETLHGDPPPGVRDFDTGLLHAHDACMTMDRLREKVVARIREARRMADAGRGTAARAYWDGIEAAARGFAVDLGILEHPAQELPEPASRSS